MQDVVCEQPLLPSTLGFGTFRSSGALHDRVSGTCTTDIGHTKSSAS